MRLQSLAAVSCFALAAVLSGCSTAGGSRSFTAAQVAPSDAYADLSATEIVAAIVGGDGSAEARSALRARGPMGLQAALGGYRLATEAGRDAATLDRLAAAVDAAAKQKDAIHTGLYWYTDLEDAKRAAKAEGKPILSLRMLGHLDDELSCANSRFFRTTLYPQEIVKSRLADKWILHWSSERPVPVVTIDYGDGRVVKRTITGNSIHYVLDANGRVVDAIPGLYSAPAFARELDDDWAVAMTNGDHDVTVAAFHVGALQKTSDEWNLTSVALGIPAMPVALTAQPMPGFIGYPAPAVAAIPSAPAKSAVEMPVVRRIAPAIALPRPTDLDRVDWKSVAAGLRADVTIDEPTRAIMRAKAPLDWSTGAPKPIDDAGFERLVEAYEGHVAEDMARNKYAYHPAIRGWLRDDPSMELGALNARVYSELFLTPANDPWLGLVPPVAYSGIQGDGFEPR